MLHLAETTAEQLKIGGANILQRDRTLLLLRRLLQVGVWGLVLLLTYEWIGFVLGRFPYTRPWGEHLKAFRLRPGARPALAIARAMPGC